MREEKGKPNKAKAKQRTTKTIKARQYRGKMERRTRNHKDKCG